MAKVAGRRFRPHVHRLLQAPGHGERKQDYPSQMNKRIRMANSPYAPHALFMRKIFYVEGLQCIDDLRRPSNLSF
jgi:hypothetical protein